MNKTLNKLKKLVNELNDSLDNSDLAEIVMKYAIAAQASLEEYIKSGHELNVEEED